MMGLIPISFGIILIILGTSICFQDQMNKKLKNYIWVDDALQVKTTTLRFGDSFTDQGGNPIKPVTVIEIVEKEIKP